MHIGKNDLLAGVPAKRLRDALAKMGNDSWSRKTLREELGPLRSVRPQPGARQGMINRRLFSCS
jgi:hypothetical protein